MLAIQLRDIGVLGVGIRRDTRDMCPSNVLQASPVSKIASSMSSQVLLHELLRMSEDSYVTIAVPHISCCMY